MYLDNSFVFFILNSVLRNCKCDTNCAGYSCKLLIVCSALSKDLSIFESSVK